MDIKPLTFSYDTNVVSEEQFNQHIILYKGYVNKTNSIAKELKNDGVSADANATYSIYRGLKKGQTYAMDGVILHEEYFRNMSKTPSSPGRLVMEVINETFGSYSNFEEQFTACAKAARGWCNLTYEQRTQSYTIFLQDTHDDGVVTMSYPILVLDMYEHAYFLDYQTNKEKYIQAFMSGIDWNTVERRLLKLYGTRKRH